MSEQDKQTKITELKAKLEGINSEIVKSNEECEDIQGEFGVMQKDVKNMIKLFDKSRFYLSVASQMSYDENTCFNESNIIHYLAELEEYISSLITYVATKREDPNAAISSVPLDKLNQKEFNRREI
jgi:hypothetical protein